MLLSIGDAIEASRCLDLHYEAQVGTESSRTRRIIEPYGVVGKLGKWYLVAYCRLRKDFRTFRLDRVLSLAPLDQIFQPVPDFDFRAYAEKNLTWYPGKWVAEILFLGDLKTVRARLPASYDGSLEPREDGVYSRWPIDGPRWACRYLLYAELPFRILGPPELLAAMSAVAEEALRVAAGQSNWDLPRL